MSGVPLYAALVAFGFLAGAAAGLLGIGGGIMIIPFLTLVAGVSQHQAEATSLLVILPTAIVATIVLRRKGIGDAAPRTPLRHGRCRRRSDRRARRTRLACARPAPRVRALPRGGHRAPPARRAHHEVGLG